MSAYHPSTTTSLLKFSPTTARFPSFSPPVNQSLKPFPGFWPFVAKDKWLNFSFGVECNAISNKTHTKEHTNFFQSDLPVADWLEILEVDKKGENLKSSSSSKIKEYLDSIREMFGSMDDGEISVSAYDTAWVALVEDVNGSGTPQFPSSLQWIADNQLPDGSWGDDQIFLAHDRILNTLACVIALRSWNIHPQKFERGMSFIKENMHRLEDEDIEHMPIGFEVAFPSLMEIAQALDIQIPDDLSILQEIYERRNLKLTRIPKDIMNKVPTTLLHSLEGMPEPQWEKLLKLQCSDGSFLFSPSSTAYALMHTKDDNCLRYLTNAVEKFNGGVPNVYPVDLFEHIWVVDRLQRLGISRYFQSEIKECMDYVFRYWTKEGICWARNSRVHDIDDTAMAFRLLRLHGYEVSQDVFRNFENKGEFFCFAGQSNQAVTGMFNLFRASQLMFPGEKVLKDAKKFSSEFLREKQVAKQLLDKWIITKDLPGEVGYALDLPWYTSLPRVETSFYLEQYGGQDDVWIGKTLYRMPYVNNNIYLELAKLDFAKCQAIHQLEWSRMNDWYAEYNLEEFGMSERSLLLSYYLAASSLFEPELSNLRFAWAKTAALVETIRSYFGSHENSIGQRKAFVHEFKKNSHNLDYVNFQRYSEGHELLRTLLGTLKQLILDTLLTHGIDIHHHLRHAWETWLLTWEDEGDVDKGEAELLERTLNVCAGRWVSEQLLSHPHYQRLSNITNRLCHQLRLFQYKKVNDELDGCCNTYTDSFSTTVEIESNMQELVQLVLCDSSDSLDREFKQTFLVIARTFYYTAYSNPEIINDHINKVLFQKDRSGYSH